jgi:hypothetical protein
LAVANSVLIPSTASSPFLIIATLSFNVRQPFSQAYTIIASAASASACLDMLEPKRSLSPAFRNASASTLPLTRAPNGFRLLFDNARECEVHVRVSQRSQITIRQDFGKASSNRPKREHSATSAQSSTPSWPLPLIKFIIAASYFSVGANGEKVCP